PPWRRRRARRCPSAATRTGRRRPRAGAGWRRVPFRRAPCRAIRPPATRHRRAGPPPPRRGPARPPVGSRLRPRHGAPRSASPPPPALRASYLLTAGTTRLGRAALACHDELHALAAREPEPLDGEAERRQLAGRRVARASRAESAGRQRGHAQDAPPPRPRL